ncbi:hypothetical protein [Ruegeria sp. HKCCA5014]|uniref:hypothetical protein n=1 Tax=Ruegeria sp. HKCCA5014 TaxID=2682980 RepID=UPI00352FF310
MDDANFKKTGLNCGHLQEFYGFLPRFRHILNLRFTKLIGGRFSEAAMTTKHLEFDQRVTRLVKKHDKLSRGYRTTMRSDGLVVMKPQRVRSGIPAKFLLLCILGFIGFKALLLTHLGAGAYENRVASLSEGTSVEKAGAWIMQADPVSEFAASQLAKIWY